MVALNSKNFSSGLHSSDIQYHNNIKKTFFLKILFTHDLRMIRIGLNFLTWPKITFPALLVIFDFSNFQVSTNMHMFLKIIVMVISMQISTLILPFTIIESHFYCKLSFF